MTEPLTAAESFLVLLDDHVSALDGVKLPAVAELMHIDLKHAATHIRALLDQVRETEREDAELDGLLQRTADHARLLCPEHGLMCKGADCCCADKHGTDVPAPPGADRPCECPVRNGMVYHQRATCTDPVAAQLGWYADSSFHVPSDGHALRPPSWQCVVCENTYPGQRPEDGLCLVCADGTVKPLIGSTVALCNDDPNPLVGRIVAVYPVDQTAEVTWMDGNGVTTRESLSGLRPFRPRHLSVAKEGDTS